METGTGNRLSQATRRSRALQDSALSREFSQRRSQLALEAVQRYAAGAESLKDERNVRCAGNRPPRGYAADLSSPPFSITKLAIRSTPSPFFSLVNTNGPF